MTLDFYPSPRSDNSLLVKSDLPRLSKRSGSTLFPQVPNKSSHSKSHSISHPHLRSTAKLHALGPSQFFNQEPSARSLSSLCVHKTPSTPPRKHRYSSSLSHTPSVHPVVASSDANPESSSHFVFAFPSPVSPHTPTRSRRSKVPPPTSPGLRFSPRARATLAMSVQVHSAILDSPSNHFHQPSPRKPQQPLLDMYPGPASPRRQSINHPSRPVSPTVSIRPSSRSEQLLRDTLRRAEEHDRARERTTSPFFLFSGHPNPGQDEEDCECEDDDIQALLFKSPSSGVSAEFNITLPSSSKLVRNKSLDQKSIRSGTSATGSRRSTLHRSPRCTSQNHGEEQSETPHDAVLRSRLEGVLNQAREKKRSTGDRSVGRPRRLTRDSSEDWGSAVSIPPLVKSQQSPHSSPRQTSFQSLTPPLTPPPHTTATLCNSPELLHSSPRIIRSPQLPYTPPSPSFNARTAAAMCRQINGYVSFANVEGLGAPPETDEEDEQIGQRPTWLRWFGLKSPTVNSSEETISRA